MIWGCINFSFVYLRDSFVGYRILGWQSFSFNTLNMHPIAFLYPWYLMRSQLLMLLKIPCMQCIASPLLLLRCSLSSWLTIVYYNASRCQAPWIYLIAYSLGILLVQMNVSHQIWGFSDILSLNVLSIPFFLSSYCRSHILHMLLHLLVSYRSQDLFFYLFFFPYVLK